MFERSPVNVRIKISALWASMLFTFAYVDLFSLYRQDVRAALADGKVGGFTVGEPFLAGTTAYVVVPALMVVSRPRPAGEGQPNRKPGACRGIRADLRRECSRRMDLLPPGSRGRAGPARGRCLLRVDLATAGRNDSRRRAERASDT